MPTSAEAFGSLTVVVPAYRAERCIAGTLDHVQAWLESSGLKHEVIVVSDDSPDRTADLVRQRGRGVVLLSNPTNLGKGDSVRRGMLAARSDWAVFTDADNSTSIDHLDAFAAHAATAQVIVASRFAPGAVLVRPRPAARRAMGHAFPILANAMARTGVRDTQCGFKLFRRDAAREIFSRLRIDGFAFDVEALMLANRLGFRIAEAPIRWDNPDESTLSPMAESVRMLAQVAAASWRLRRSRPLEPPRPD